MTQQRMGRFLKACGAEGPLTLLVERDGGTAVGRWSLPQPFAVVGRHPRLELTLDDEDVSLRHAFLIVLGGRVFCVDLGSRHGLTWDGIVVPSGWLDPGQSIGLGPYQVRLEEAIHGSESWMAPHVNPLVMDEPSLRDTLMPVTLETPNRSGHAKRLRVRQMLTLIGRAPDCRLQIRDEGISRYHAVLVRLPDGLWVVDLASRDGVRVNGARVRWSELADGDHLHLGRYRVIVRVGDSARPNDARPEAIEDSIPPLPPDQLPALLTGVGMPAPAPRAGGTIEVRQILEGQPPEQVAMAEALLQPIMQQFGLMQQQMFDQFHETMLSMFQMFGSLHRDQMGLVRAELDRIRQLGQELQALQAQQQKRQPDPVPGPPPELPRTADAAMAPRPQSMSAPGTEDAARREEPRLGSSESPPPARSRRDPGQPSSLPPRTQPAPATPADLHRQIAQRIQELQQERQTRWHRLLTLMGKSGPG